MSHSAFNYLLPILAHAPVETQNVTHPTYESFVAVRQDMSVTMVASETPSQREDTQSSSLVDQTARVDGQQPDDAITVTARPGSFAADPLDGVNIKSFEVVQSVDKAVTAPVAIAYKNVVPTPIRSSLRNVLSNLHEPVVSLNYLLQLKPGKSVETLGRFAINSTVGIGGLIDVAKTRHFKLPRRTNGFAYTLGYYGVKSGAYLYLPLIGPTTVRDLGGRLLDLSLLPVAIGKPLSDPAFAIPTTAVRLIDERAESDREVRELRETSDPYVSVRERYLQSRQEEIDALRKPREITGESERSTAEPSNAVIPGETPQ